MYIFIFFNNYLSFRKSYFYTFRWMRIQYVHNRFIFYVSLYEFFYNIILVKIILDLYKNYLLYIYIIFRLCVLVLLKMLIVFYFIYPDIYQDIYQDIYLFFDNFLMCVSKSI